MADQYGLFWNSVNNDRGYTADSFSEWLNHFFTTGVFSGELQVTAVSGMDIKVASGYANLKGKVRFFDSATTYTLATAGATYPRIDTVVVERNDTDRKISIKVVTGTYNGSNPSPTAPVRSAAIYQIVLAQIYVAAGATKITQENITDTRSNNSICGIVTGTVKEMDYSQFAAQFNSYYSNFKTSNKADFDAWFNEIKGQLTSDAAALLQTEVNTVNSKLDNLQVGGRNLLLNSDGAFTMGYGVPTTTWNESTGKSEISLPVTTSSPEILPQEASFGKTYRFSIGGTYTQSITVETDANIIKYADDLSWYDNDKKNHHFCKYKINSVGKNTYVISSTYTIGEDESGTVRIFDMFIGRSFDFTTGTYLRFYHPKIECGTVATDWTPAPEDVDSKIDGLNNNGPNVLHEYVPRPASANDIPGDDSKLKWFLSSSDMTEGKPTGEGYIIQFSWNGSNWPSQLFIPSSGGKATPQFREYNLTSDEWSKWINIYSEEIPQSSTTKSFTLSASSWSSGSYTISDALITATSNQEILPATNITADRMKALQKANIVDAGQEAGSMTIKCLGTAPTIDIPIRVIFRGTI